jgi:oligopeptidase B
MQKIFLLAIAAVMALGACKQAPKETAAAPMRTQSDYPAAPMAAINPQTFTEHGYTRVDDYYWLKDKTDPQVTAYLNAENTYADTVMAHTKALQETLFAEMKGRIKEDDTSCTLSRKRVLLLLAHRNRQTVPHSLPQKRRPECAGGNHH